MIYVDVGKLGDFEAKKPSLNEKLGLEMSQATQLMIQEGKP